MIELVKLHLGAHDAMDCLFLIGRCVQPLLVARALQLHGWHVVVDVHHFCDQIRTRRGESALLRVLVLVPALALGLAMFAQAASAWSDSKHWHPLYLLASLSY